MKSNPPMTPPTTLPTMPPMFTCAPLFLDKEVGVGVDVDVDVDADVGIDVDDVADAGAVASNIDRKGKIQS